METAVTIERQEIEVTNVEANGTVEKGPDGFSLPIAYVLADGQRIETRYTRKLKRDVVAFAATLPAAPSNPTKAVFRDGRYIGTRTSFYIGPRT